MNCGERTKQRRKDDQISVKDDKREKMQLDGGEAFLYGYAGGWGEGEVGVLDGDVLLHGGEGELGGGTVYLFEAHVLDGSGGGDLEGEELDALGEAFGDAGDLVAVEFWGLTVMLSSSLASSVWPRRKRSGERRSSSFLAGIRWAWASPGV